MHGTLRITGAPPLTTVTVNGEVIPATSLELRLDAESVPHATVGFFPLDGLDIDISADVTVSEATREALARLGWTPPDDDGRRPEMSDAEFDRRLRKWAVRNPVEYARDLVRLSHGEALRQGGLRPGR